MDFFYREHCGHAFWTSGADGFDGEFRGFIQDSSVEKQDRAQCLILCRSGDVFSCRQVGEKRLDFASAHVDRMSIGVEVDEAPDPG